MEPVRPQLGRVVVTPLLTVGLLSAILVWEVEHVGSVLLAVIIAVIGVLVGVFVARSVRRQIEELEGHYAALLRTADEQSQRAETANRLKDEFLATLSHELRTPLNSILGWSRMLATGKLDHEQTTKAVQAIERAGWAQSHLIEDLLDISRIVTGKLQITPRPTLLRPLVESAVHALRPAADAKQITIDLAFDPALGPISADPDRLQQIVWNLLSNAIKFTPSRGRVAIQVGADNAECITIRVTDTGIGFSSDTAAHLFERFRQGDSSTTREYAGLGLGLGIVRHLVELHGGTVTAHSEGENRGAEFVVRLPLLPARDYVPDVQVSPQTPPVLRGVSVLAVDDDPAALDFVRSSLESYGAVVLTARTADEARERIRREPPDVLVSDLKMPEGDGLDLIREVRELDAHTGRRTPAAALTALTRAEDRRLALDAGFQMHVAKPVDPLELAAAVERLAAHR